MSEFCEKPLLFIWVGLFLLLTIGCSPKKQAQTIVLLEGPSETVRKVQKWLHEHPQEASTWFGKDWTIQVFPSKPDMEHKIITIQPDPNIDFKITILNPRGPIPPGLLEKIRPLLRRNPPTLP